MFGKLCAPAMCGRASTNTPHKVGGEEEIRKAQYLQRKGDTHRIYGGVRIYLQSVDVICGILEEAIVRIQHLVAKQIQPFPRTKKRQRQKDYP